MAKEYFTLHPGERIILQKEDVAHNSMSYDDIIVLTTDRLILIDKGFFGKVQEGISVAFESISQVIGVGELELREEELELYIEGRKHSVKMGSTPYLASLWAMAINDRFSEYADKLSYEYYNSLSFERARRQAELELQREEEQAAQKRELVIQKSEQVAQKNDNSSSTIDFATNVAKNLLKSKQFTPTGVVKSGVKAAEKQKRQTIRNSVIENSILGSFKNTGNEMKNILREEIEQMPLPVPEFMMTEKQQRIKRRAEQIYSQQIEEARKRFIGPEYKSGVEAEIKSDDENKINANASYAVDQQIEMLSKLKSLLDAGILTQEEFDQKKREILQ